MKEKIENIKNNSGLDLFFEYLWEKNSIFAKIFFAHREEIFPKVSESSQRISPMYLFWSNLLNQNEESFKEIITAMKLRDKEAKIESKELALKILSSVGIEEINWHGVDLRDLIIYYLIRFVRLHKSVKELVNENEFSLKKLKETLKDYENIDLDFISEDINYVYEGNLHEIEDELLRANYAKIRKNISNIWDIFQHFFSYLVVSRKSSDLINIIISLFVYFNSSLKDLWKKRNSNFEEYTDAMVELYQLRLIKEQKTVFWCKKCLNPSQILLSESIIVPFSLDMKCFNCHEKMNIVSMIKIDEHIIDSMLSQDGLLGTAIAWLLDKKGWKWDYSVVNKYEKDFICDTSQGKVLFEVKMHFTPEKERSVRGAITQEISRLVKHVEDLKKGNENLARAYLVYNYDLTKFSEIAKDVINSRFFAEAKDQKIDVIGYNSLPSILDELKK